MKKILLLTVVVLFIFCSATVHAQDFRLTIDSTSAKNGETITLNLTLSDNPGIIAALFELSYDREKLTLIKAEDKKLLPGAVFSQTYDKYPYIMLWNSSSAKNFTKNGVLATLTFKVNDNAKSGDAFVNIAYIPDNVYNVDLVNVDLNIINGIISVDGIPAQDITPETATPAPSVPDSVPTDTNTTPPTADIPSSGTVYTPSGTSPHPSSSTSKFKDSQTNAETQNTAMTFDDISPADWYYDSVAYVFKNGLMKGTTDTDFSPELPLTRGMLVTVLHRIEGSPHVAENSKFTDVDKEVYYANAVNWAKQNGIVNGVTETEFAPDTNITREQIVIILYRYSLLKKHNTDIGKNTSIAQYNDFPLVSEYAIQAMQYAIESGLIKGDTSGNLNPQGLATRAEIATILHRFMEK